MKTRTIYYVILFVYLVLLACQLIVGHMTHSLIILTDSYINLYKIFDILLAIVHLRTQHELTNRQHDDKRRSLADAAKCAKNKPVLAARLFNCYCTYDFKRLHLLGSFMNGLFLAALLMSAAIEGIQTCGHSSHSQNPSTENVLHRDPLTYPLTLAGFALVGLIMQRCSIVAHRLREEELQSESLLDIPSATANLSRGTGGLVQIRELSISDLVSETPSTSTSSSKRHSYNLNTLQRQSSDSRLRGNNVSLQELPMRPTVAECDIPDNQENRISLKSLKMAVNLDTIASPLNEPNGKSSPIKSERLKPTVAQDSWFMIRYMTSPLALLTYANIDYFAKDSLALEIADASLSIVVVILLFAASYPPMKKAGMVLLQTTPDGVDLVRLEKELLTLSGHILEVRELRVWSLTPRSNRVATCQLALDKGLLIGDQKETVRLLAEAGRIFLGQNIKCITIEPVFVCRDQR